MWCDKLTRCGSLQQMPSSPLSPAQRVKQDRESVTTVITCLVNCCFAEFEHAAGLNGRVASITGYDALEERWEVVDCKSAETLLVKPENLVPSDQ